MTTNPNGCSRRALLKWLAGLSAIGALSSLLYRSRRPATTGESPHIISRSEWGAEDPDPSLRDAQGPELFNTVVVHHSALPLTDGPREIQAGHMHGRGFLDIGYHFVIDDRGYIYEGRSLAVHGAHASGHNAGTLGIVLLGNFEETEPTPGQLASLKSLIRDLVGKHPLTHLAGHRDFQPGKTVCPGRNLAPRLPRLAAESGLKFGTDGYVGPEPASTTPALTQRVAPAKPAPNDDTLARMLATQVGGGGSLPVGLGLAPGEFSALLGRHFPGVTLPATSRPPPVWDPRLLEEHACWRKRRN